MRSTCGQPSRGSLDRLVDELDPVGERVEQHRAVQRFLRREVVQQARAADADLVGDLVEARAGVAVLGEAAARDLEDQLLRGRSTMSSFGEGRSSDCGLEAVSHDASLPTGR